jgi:predicted HicB family RNase H-like nuclease
MGTKGDLTDVAKRQQEKTEQAQEQAEKAAQEPTKRLNANVPESLHRAVRMEAARRGVDMKDVMVEALTEYLPNYSPE